MSIQRRANAIVRFVTAFISYRARKSIGDDALSVLTDSLLSSVGDEASESITTFFNNRQAVDALLEAGEEADRCFRARCSDPTLQQLGQMPIGDLPSIQAAINSLPKTVDRSLLSEALQSVLKDDYGSQLSDDQISEASNLYLECLEEQLLKVDGVREIVTGLATLNIERTAMRIEGKVDRGTKDTMSMLEQMRDLQLGGALKGTNELVKQAELMNPGLKIEARSLGNEGTHVLISATPSAVGTDIGTLRFSGDKPLTVGLAKFQKALDEGRPVTLEPGEFEWESAVKFPEALAMGQDNFRMTFAPSTPNVDIPVRIVCNGIDGRSVVIDYALYRLVRQGRTETEIEVSRGNLAGTISFVDKKDSTQKVSADIALDSQSPGKVLRSLELLELIRAGANITVIPLEHEAPLIYGRCNQVSPLELKYVKQLLGWLETVNRAYKLDLRYSETIDTETEKTLWLLAEGATKPYVMLERSGQTEIEVSKQMGLNLLDAIADEDVPLQNLATKYDEARIILLGHEVPTPLLHVIDAPQLDGDPVDLRKQLEALDDNSVIPIRLLHDGVYLSLQNQKFQSIIEPSRE